MPSRSRVQWTTSQKKIRHVRSVRKFNTRDARVAPSRLRGLCHMTNPTVKHIAAEVV